MTQHGPRENLDTRLRTIKGRADNERQVNDTRREQEGQEQSKRRLKLKQDTQAMTRGGGKQEGEEKRITVSERQGRTLKREARVAGWPE